MKSTRSFGQKMHKYFFDTYAIIEIIKGNPNYNQFTEELFATTTINLSEVYYYLLNEVGEYYAHETIQKLKMEYFDITPALALKAVAFRHAHKKDKLSYVDCLGYVIAIHNNLLFLTGDNGFEKIPHVAFVK